MYKYYILYVHTHENSSLATAPAMTAPAGGCLRGIRFLRTCWAAPGPDRIANDRRVEGMFKAPTS